jgi:hypothetical protein
MYPTRLQNQIDELAGGFVDGEAAGGFPTGRASDDGCGGYTDERGGDGGDSYSDSES